MDALTFLRSKNIVPADAEKFNIMAPSGPVDLIELLNEYNDALIKPQVKEMLKKPQRTKTSKK
jgi:hypothetical protein